MCWEEHLGQSWYFNKTSYKKATCLPSFSFSANKNYNIRGAATDGGPVSDGKVELAVACLHRLPENPNYGHMLLSTQWTILIKMNANCNTESPRQQEHSTMLVGDQSEAVFISEAILVFSVGVLITEEIQHFCLQGLLQEQDRCNSKAAGLNGQTNWLIMKVDLPMKWIESTRLDWTSAKKENRNHPSFSFSNLLCQSD